MSSRHTRYTNEQDTQTTCTVAYSNVHNNVYLNISVHIHIILVLVHSKFQQVGYVFLTVGLSANRINQKVSDEFLQSF